LFEYGRTDADQPAAPVIKETRVDRLAGHPSSFRD